MKTVLYNAADRGSADYGWLKPNYYFSFSQYHNPERVHFGLLRVLNDDYVAGGGGFPTHPHDNMEIVTIPFSGALQHKDSTGGQGVIKAGDVQIMSAGTGVQHSEFNASSTEPVTLFQVWETVVSPVEADQALWINQDAKFSLTKLEAGKSITYNNAFAGNGVFLVNISGAASVGDIKLGKRDAVGISETESFTITATEDTELLAIEVPMNLN
jgi:hypothetical protein